MEPSRIATRIEAPKLYVQETGTVRGMGVFAQKAFRAGEVVETAPAFLLEERLSELPIELQRRVYQWSELAGDPHSRYRALVFGFGSLYNHDTPANLLYRPDVEQQAMVYRAARAIAADEELTIDYCAEAPGGEPGDPERINFDWFRRFGIDKH